jgi:aminoglycoside phosphotransferase (APT) family kinase protein
MHVGEVVADEAIVRKMLAVQFPHWGKLQLSAVQSAGTDNAIFRLGSDMCVRLPRIDYAERQIDKECACLPKLGPLPLEIPESLAQGDPQDGFPWRWAVYRWITGETATPERLVDMREAAKTLGQFVKALQSRDASGGPMAGEATRGRGLPLSARDRRVRQAIDALGDEYDIRVLHAAWDQAVSTPVFAGKPVWIHADLHEGNLLQLDGRLTAVIDFGLAGVGDPAADLTPTWTFLPAEARRPFRDEIMPDEDAWTRGRGWALSIAVIALAYYLHTNPTLVRMSRRTIAAVLEDR